MADVPVLSPSGEPLFIDSSELAAAQQQGYTVETPEMETQRHFRQEMGVMGAPVAGLQTLASALTFGGYDAAARGVADAAGAGQEFAGSQRALEANHPVASAVGTGLGMALGIAAGGLGAAGTAGRAGMAVRAAGAPQAVLSGLAGRAGQIAGGLVKGTGLGARVGRAAVEMGTSGLLEGAAYGAGEGLRQVSISEQGFGDPALAAERILASAGHGALVGGLMGGGLGAGGVLAKGALRGAGKLIGKAVPDSLVSTLEGMTSKAGIEEAADIQLLKGMGFERGQLMAADKQYLGRAKIDAFKQRARAIYKEMSGSDDLMHSTKFRHAEVADFVGKKMDDALAANAKLVDDIAERGSVDSLQLAVDELSTVRNRLASGSSAHGDKLVARIDKIQSRLTSDSNRLRRLSLETEVRMGELNAAKAEIAAAQEAGEAVTSRMRLAENKAQSAYNAASEKASAEHIRMQTRSWKDLRATRKELDAELQPHYRKNEWDAESLDVKDIRRALEKSFEGEAERLGVGAAYQANKKDLMELGGLRTAADRLRSKDANLAFGLRDGLLASAGASAGAALGPVGGVVGGVAGGLASKLGRSSQGSVFAAALLDRAAKQGLGDAMAGVMGRTQRGVQGLTRGAAAVGTMPAKMAPLVVRQAERERRRAEEQKRTAEAYLSAPRAAAAPIMSGALAGSLARQAGAVEPPVSAAPGDATAAARPPRPSESELARYVRQSKAVRDPMSLLRHAKDGTLTTDEVEAVERSAPALLQDMRTRIEDQIGQQIMQGKVPTYKQLAQLSKLSGVPLDAALQPSFISAMQAMRQGQAEQKQRANRATMSRRPGASAQKAASQSAAGSEKWL